MRELFIGFSVLASMTFSGLVAHGDDIRQTNTAVAPGYCELHPDSSFCSGGNAPIAPISANEGASCQLCDPQGHCQACAGNVQDMPAIPGLQMDLPAPSSGSGSLSGSASNETDRLPASGSGSGSASGSGGVVH